MCKVQNFIYLTCICICILSTTTNAFAKNKNENRKRAIKTKETEKLSKTQVEKAKLRTEMKEKLKKMTPSEIQIQSKNITRLLLKHPLYTTSQKVAVYISMDSEVQTFDIIKNIFELRKKCYIPKYDKNKKLTMVRLNSIDELKKMPKTKFNITQPADDDVREDVMDKGDLDLVIVPGLAFTSYGKRLGRGFGCYDQFLNDYDKKFPENDCVSAGLAFTEQVLDDVPTTTNDHLLFFVVYPEEDID